MTDITYDWMAFETPTATKLPIRHIVRTSQAFRREDEFRSALDRYMADYRKNRELIADKTTRQLQKNQIPLGRRTAEMLSFQPWF
jgi:hypothetical protein